MLSSLAPIALLAGSLFAGLPWLRSASTVPSVATAAPQTDPTAALDRMVLLAADDPDYLAIAIPRSYKTAPGARVRLLAFRDGLCIRDHGLADAHETNDRGSVGTVVVEETGTTERGFVASDGREAVVLGTRYVSRVNMTPGTTSTADDVVSGATTLTLVDPAHPDGRWHLAIESGRWVKDVLVLPASMGVVATTFLPRSGPADVRILDLTGHELLRVPESSAETLRIEASPEGGHVAVEIAFRDSGETQERGVIVFDLARGTQWTYAWRYGSDAEPVSWTLQSGGVLSVKLVDRTRRFDATGRKL
jgi:hypothetical protein